LGEDDLFYRGGYFIFRRVVDEVKKYQIIYADPPWNIQIISRQVRPKQLDMPYTRMSYEDICNLPIQNISDPEHCHLFLWVTHKWLPKAFKVMESWGFSYNCCLTWNKTYGFTPFSFMWSTEFLLYGQLKGKWKRPIGVGKFKTCFTEKPTKHSKKPRIARRIIEGFCGDLSRIELFARKENDLFNEFEGWDVWGNEVESDIELK